MNKKDIETREKIKEAGLNDFLQNGYKDASLRRIAQNAGVTTGAIYGYYRDKNALFTDLVEPAASVLMEMFLNAQSSFEEKPGYLQTEEMYEYSSEALFKMLEYIYEHFYSFKLITCSSAGTDYEEYLHKMVITEEESTYSYIKKARESGIKVNDINENLCHILANAYINSIFEVVAHDMPWEEAKEYVSKLTSFFSVGWDKLLMSE